MDIQKIQEQINKDHWRFCKFMCHSDQAEQQILKFSDTHWTASSLSN